MGPVISGRHREKVKEYIDKGVAEGATRRAEREILQKRAELAHFIAVVSGESKYEPPADQVMLHRVLEAGRLVASADPAIVASAENVVVVIGTPVDEHLNPKQTAITKALGGCADFLQDGQLLVLRSTVYPGVTALVASLDAGNGCLDFARSSSNNSECTR